MQLLLRHCVKALPLEFVEFTVEIKGHMRIVFATVKPLQLLSLRAGTGITCRTPRQSGVDDSSEMYSASRQQEQSAWQ